MSAIKAEIFKKVWEIEDIAALPDENVK